MQLNCQACTGDLITKSLAGQFFVECCQCGRSDCAIPGIIITPFAELHPSLQDHKIIFGQTPKAKYKGEIIAHSLSTPKHETQDAYEFLQRWQLLDINLDAERCMKRYARFAKVKFGEQVDEQSKIKYMQQLVPFERSFAATQDDIGNVETFPFNIETVSDEPVCHRAICYAPEPRRQLREMCQKLCKSGVIRRVKPGDQEPLFVSSIVLVKQGQSGQDYRMCFNAVDLNAVTILSKHHVAEISQVTDELYEAKFMSLIDLKGAFSNHPVTPDSIKYLGFITQDGMFEFLTMPFGCVNAPAKLQSSLDYIVHESGQLSTAIYYDDITPFGTNETDTWDTTIRTIERIAAYGYMINLNKCRFLTNKAPLLGYMIHEGEYQLGPKALKKLFDVKIPTKYKEVQKLLGQFNWCSKLIPNYKPLIKPIEKLLSSQQEPIWSQLHTDHLNELLQAAAELVKLRIYHPSQPIFIYFSHDDSTCEVVMTQAGLEGERPFRIISRHLTKTEINTTSPLEVALSILHWAVKKSAKYTAYHSFPIICMLKNPEQKVLVQQADCNVRLRAKVLDMCSYGVEFGIEPIRWDFGGLLQSIRQKEQEGCETQQQPVAIIHKDTKITMTKGKGRQGVQCKATVDYNGKWKAFFDGSFRKGLAGGGFVVYDQEENVVGGRALYFGKGTNNLAEAQACEALFEYLATLSSQEQTIVIHGDSALIINFLIGNSKPKQLGLLQIMRRIRRVVDRLPSQLIYVHVPREQNKVADWLAQQGLKLGQSKSIEELCPELKQNNADSIGAVLTHDGQENPQEQRTCISCGYGSDSRMTECWGCDAQVHDYCRGDGFAGSRIPYYCPGCKIKFKDTYDLTLDHDLMRFICDGIEPQNDNKRDICIKAGLFIEWRDGKVVMNSHKGGVQVPPIRDRHRIIDETAKMMGLPNGARLYQLLRETFWWRGMREACNKYCDTSVARQIEQARFKSPPYLFPTFKGLEPFTTWAIDCITPLKPPAPNGGVTIVVAIDCWSKWLEYKIINPLDSRETARFLFEDIICRYGTPISIRRDQGREFQGDFQRLCDQFGIRLQSISTLNPRANGLIERYNREIKAGIRRLITQCSSAQWYEVLPDVFNGLRHLPTTTTKHSPFQLVYKQEARLPIPLQLTAIDLEECPITAADDNPDLLQRQLQLLHNYWEVIRSEVNQRLTQQDERMVKAYGGRKDLNKVDLRLIFKQGDQCIHKQKQPGKLRLKAQGPYTFIEYLGERRANATIADSKGKRFRCAVVNLLPIRTDTRPTKRFHISEQPRPPDLQPEGSSYLEDDSDLYEIDESDLAPIRGVILTKRARYNWDKDLWPSDNES